MDLRIFDIVILHALVQYRFYIVSKTKMTIPKLCKVSLGNNQISFNMILIHLLDSNFDSINSYTINGIVQRAQIQNIQSWMGGGGERGVLTMVSPFFKQRISQRAVRTAFEKQLDPNGPIAFRGGPYKYF